MKYDIYDSRPLCNVCPFVSDYDCYDCLSFAETVKLYGYLDWIDNSKFIFVFGSKDR